MLSESVQTFFLVFKLCQSLAQSVGAAPSGNARQLQRQLLRARAGSCWLSSPLEDQVCASGNKEALGARMRAAAPLQVMLGGGWGRELRRPTLIHKSLVPGWDVAKGCFPGRQTWGATNDSGWRERVGKRPGKKQWSH